LARLRYALSPRLFEAVKEWIGRGALWEAADVGLAGLGRGELGSDALEEDAGGLVVEVLGDELAFEGALEDGLAEALGAFEVGVDGGFELADDGEAAVDFGDDAVLFGERWDRNRHFSEITASDAGLTSGGLDPCSDELSRDASV